jgi:membrane protein required for colicin V production
MPLTLLDVIVLGVMLLSALLGAGRGLLRTIVAVICCTVASLVPLLVRVGMPENSALSYAISSLLSIGMLVVLLVIAARILHRVLADRINVFDRSLGFLFGLVRGPIIPGFAFIFYAWLVPERLQPDWIKYAKSKVVLQGTADWVMSLLPGADQEWTIASLILALVLNGVLLGVVVDFFAVITRWMGRNRR